MNFAGRDKTRFCDVANGPGCRATLFVSGCRIHCKNCFNAECQDFNYGDPFTEEDLLWFLDKCDHPYVAGLTVLGGEPMDVDNQPEVSKIVTSFRKRFPDKTIWVFTGYVLEKHLDPGRPMYTHYTPVILDNIDVLVDGPFVEELKDISLKFRGSSNQRIIHLKDGVPERIE